MKKIEVKVITGVKAKIPEKINLELSRREAVLALGWVGNAVEFHARELQHPHRMTRRALRKREISQQDLRQMYRDARNINDKLASALTGIRADELETLIEKFKEGTL